MLKTLILPALLFLLSLSATAQKAEIKAVQKTFEKYKATLQQKDGEAAIAYVTASTIQYYNDLLEKVKTADSTEIAAMPLLDKLTVLTVRHRSSKEEIFSYDGRTFFIGAINDGTTNADAMDKFKLGEVKINGNSARMALMTADGTAVPFSFHFKKEDDTWKLDLAAFVSILSGILEKEMEGEDIFSNENLFMILEMLNGEKPSPDIWHPLTD